MYKDVYIDELRLNLIYGDFNENDLEVISRKQYKVGDYIVEIAIIGASHYISFIKDCKKIFSEVFACVEYNYIKNYKGQELIFRKEDIFNYSFSSYVFNISEEYNRIESFKENHDLYYDFGPNDAFTALRFKTKNNLINLETIHVYPNEGRAIVTTSSFSV